MPRRGRSSGDGTATPPKRTRRYNLRPTSSRKNRDRMLGGEQDGRRTLVTDEELREKNKALKPQSVGAALKVSAIDFNGQKNREAHHTDEYEMESLVLRRGQEFVFTVTFDRDVSKDQDLIFLKFVTGSRPQESKGTLVNIPVTFDKVVSDDWTASATEVKDKSLTVAITSAADSNIGKYEMFVQTKVKGSDKDLTNHAHADAFYMLFNPFCKDDVVYMENESHRDEYVMNDSGRVWIGNRWRNRGKPWNFGQFDNPCLEVALDLLDKGELGDSARNSVVSIIRCISAMANCCDDEGVLTGRWTSEYPKDCTKPWEWTGSVAILEQYHKTGKPVKYGQCWVFSCLTTTILRALGIPTRTVTNFDSAHDTDCSMTIDKHFDSNGDAYDDGDNDDSTWNFHVWNESWCRRLDLPEGYDGWQAHDATPQETSEGVMRCGPASLRAIKLGHVYLSYDVGFIFSEVNGDKCKWEVDEDGKMNIMDIDRHAVGHCISTKAVGSQDRHDLTLDYKFADGSSEEAEVLRFVNRFSTANKRNLYKNAKKPEVKFELIAPTGRQIGEEIEVGVFLTNTADEDRTVRVRLTLRSTFYTGVLGKRAKADTIETSVKAGETKPVTMMVTSDEYEAVMNPEADFNLTASCRVLETNNMFASQEVFSLDKPELVFKAPERICSYTETTATLQFTNTTNLKLHNAVFNVEGSYLIRSKSYPIRKVIHPDETISVEVPMKGLRLRTRYAFATFSSDELTGVEGETSVYVVSKSDWKDEDMEASD